VIGGGMLTFAGGKGANQAVAAARLGARVAMVGRTGDDDAGWALTAALAAEGVDVSGVSRDPATPTGAALIMIERGGQNLIAVAPGATPRWATPRSPMRSSASGRTTSWSSSSRSRSGPSTTCQRQ